MENFLDILDGQRVYEDIAFSDSYGRIFSAIPDGSYLFIKNGKEELTLLYCDGVSFQLIRGEK